MKIACAEALAKLAREDVPDEVAAAYSGIRPRYGPDYIIPAPFDPIIGVSLSNNYCDSLSDISFNVTQVANEPDMSSISIISNEGFFIIDSLSIGDTVGYSNVVAGGGFINSDYTLIIDDIPSSYIAKVALNNDSTNCLES